MKMKEVDQVDEKKSPADKVADVMIGAALEAANVMTGLRSEGLDPEKLMPLYAEDQFIHLIPTVDFAAQKQFRRGTQAAQVIDYFAANRSEEHTSELQSLMRISYAVFCLKKKKKYLVQQY